MDMYFVALVLPEELDKKVLVWKQYMFQNFKCTVGLKSPAHITIIPPFWMNPEKEKDLINDIDSLSAHIKAFNLETNNFSAFKPRTIFIAINENNHLAELKRRATEFFKEKDYKIKAESRPFHPHITIATRDLYKKQFHEAWNYFQNKEFVEAWQANGLSILHHNKKNWDVVYTSQFL
jgi:2'-5' RNA ligase